jgi:uncharacterized membrane-anchored protein YitT (DUF2179 family)
MASHNRGVTMVDCSGGFSGRQMQMLFTVVPFQDLSGLKQTIHQIDPAAFVVVSDTLEVMATGSEISPTGRAVHFRIHALLPGFPARLTSKNG